MRDAREAPELRDWYVNLRARLLLAADQRTVDPAKARVLDRLMLDLLDDLDVRAADRAPARAA